MGRQEARGSTGAHSTIIILIEINFKKNKSTVSWTAAGRLFLQDHDDSSGEGV